MNMKRFLLAVVAGYIFIFATDFLIHDIWLAPNYEATASIWRSRDQMQACVAWMFAARIIFVVVFILIWAKGFAARGPRFGWTYGLLMGLFAQATGTFVIYVVVPVPPEIPIKSFFGEMAQAILLGVLTAWIYKPKALSM